MEQIEVVFIYFLTYLSLMCLYIQYAALPVEETEENAVDPDFLQEFISELQQEGAIDEETAFEGEEIESEGGFEKENEEGNAGTVELNLPVEDSSLLNKDGFHRTLLVEGFHYVYKEKFVSKRNWEITAYYRCRCYKSACKAAFSLKEKVITFGKFQHSCLERVPKRRRLELDNVLNVCAEMRSKCIELALLEPGTAANHIAQNVLNIFDRKYGGKYFY